MKKLDWRIFALFVLVVVIYCNGLFSGFVWDDKILVLDKAAFFSDFRNALRILDLPDSELGRITPYYRPLNTLSYMLDHFIWGLNPFWYHLENILLHAATAILLYLVLMEIFLEDWKIAFFAGVFFAVYPVNAEAVDAIFNRNTLFCAAFSLASLFFLAKQGSAKWKVFSLLAYSLALLSKEQAVVLPFFLLSLGLTVQNGKLKTGWKMLSGFFAITIFYFFIRQYVLGTFLVSGQSIMFSPERLKLISAVVFEHFRLMFFPFKLNASYSDHNVFFTPLKAVLAVLGVTALGLPSFFKKTPSAVKAGSQWIFWGLLPVSNIVPIPSAPVAERYLYTVLPGFVLLLGYGLSRLSEKKKAVPVTAFMILLSLSLGARTFMRNFIWENNESLFASMINADPKNAGALTNLGNCYLSESRQGDAFRLYQSAVKLDPGFGKAHTGLGLVYLGENRLAGAENEFKKTVALDPGDPFAHANLALAYMGLNMYDMAVQELQTAAWMRPSDARIRVNLGKAYMAQNRPDKAIPELASAIKIEPGNVPAHMNLGIALAKQNMPDAAEHEFLKTIELDPKMVDAYVNLGITYMGKGLMDEAFQEFQEALSLNSSNIAAHNNLGVIYAGRNNFREALKEFQTVLKIDPANQIARRDLSLISNSQR